MDSKKFRSTSQNKTIPSSPPPSSPPPPAQNKTIPSSPPPSSPPPPPLSHHVYPSFHGADVRKSFLSHVLKEFRRKGIDLFVDYDIKRSKSIGPELTQAIRGSKIALVMLSRNYASSSWCLDELVELMMCWAELNLVVVTVYYELEPVEVRKQIGDFGKLFLRTCKGKTEEHIVRWGRALSQVATIAGYSSQDWRDEASLIEDIASTISNILIRSSPSRDFDGFVRMEAHMRKMEPMLCMDSDEVKMIGILGPFGIGKTTIARFLYQQLSHQFQLTAFMSEVKSFYPRPCYDEYNAKLQLQKHLLSEITNQSDIKIHHLGVLQERLRDKKVLVVLDEVDHIEQLNALARETWWYGPGSRIIITTQDPRLLKAHGINHTYKVDLPAPDEALQIFCLYAFGQKFPEDRFIRLSKEVTELAGVLPLRLKLIGSSLRGLSMAEWKRSLPRLSAWLDREMGNFTATDISNTLTSDYEDQVEMEAHVEKTEPMFNFDSDEENMVEAIVSDNEIELNNSASSSVFDSLVGMEAHMKNMEPMLCMDSDEVKMIGILGPFGIGKTTIARFLYQQLSHQFQLTAFMSEVKSFYPRPCYDEYDAKLRLQKHLLSEITNQNDIKIHHLGVLQERLRDKKVLVVLDEVDHIEQLNALAKETWWYGPGSRIIITTQDPRLLKAHGINHTYKVDLPAPDEALQIFCLYAFGQHFPEDRFIRLSKEVTELAGELPLRLKLIGSFLRGMSMEEWKWSLPRLLAWLDREMGKFAATDISNTLTSDYDDQVEMEAHVEKTEPVFNFDSDEENMVEAIVSDNEIELNNSASSSVFDSLVGMEAHMRNMEPMLCMDSDEVRMIGIVGPSGIGKTTIALYLYQQLYHQFQWSTIMANIKEFNASTCDNEYNAKLQLQYQLLSQLINQNDTDEIFHLGVVQEMLKDNKALIVLDDVVGLGQLDALIKEARGLGIGSRIIITTRNERLLKEYGIDHIYKVDFPPPDEALQIFCTYTFGQKSPCDGFVKLAQEVTTLSGKLPLGLELMGTYLQGMSKQEWINELPRLRCSLDGDIRSVLKLSYDSLCGDDKESFHHHIACISNGDCNETVEEYLAKSFSGVRQEVIITNQDLKDLYTNERAFEGISNGLLRWECCPLTCWPSEWYPESLFELYIPHNKLEKLWEGIRPLRKLRLMDLSSSKNLKELPDLSTAINLKRLDLRCCSSMVKLPDSIGDATGLLVLTLEYCTSLVDLPSSIGNITNLKELYLTGCSSLVKLPSSIGNATNLQEVCLRYCSSLVELPSSIGNAINLQKLNLEYCSSLVKLPSSIGNAINLRELYLTGCSSLVELPTSIGNATNLQKLNLEYCASLVKLPSSTGNAINLKELYLTGCSSLVELPPSIGIATKLEILNVSNCSSLVDLPYSIGNVNSLHYLYISNCSCLVLLPNSIGNATNLWELDLSNCSSLVELPSSIGNASGLRRLDLRNCSSLVELPSSIGNATNLEYLYLSNCSSLRKLPSSIGDGTSLQYLYLNNCSNLMEVPDSIGDAINLKKLDLSWCTSLVKLPASITNSTSLWQLDLDNCSNLLEVPNGVRLKKLDLSW